MRISFTHLGLAASLLLFLPLLTAAQGRAAEVHPVDADLRRMFPTLALDSTAKFEPANTFVDVRLTNGLRAQQSGDSMLSVLYPSSYDGLLIVELGKQRVVLRAINASASSAAESAGKLVYPQPYASTDAVEVPRGGRSEEILLLRDARAPRVFEYEIVATTGVTAVALDHGAIRFLPSLDPLPAVAGGHFTHIEPSLQIDRPWMLDRWGKRSETQARWSVAGKGAIPKTIRLTVTTERLAFPMVVDPSFSVTGAMTQARSRHTATLLRNGKVAIAGGYSRFSYNGKVTELYESTSGSFSTTVRMATGRFGHTATLLADGTVLVAGGNTGSQRLSSAELYDPASNTYSATRPLATERVWHTATLLRNGKVLIVGGVIGGDITLNSAELYDPINRTFTATGPLNTSRACHSATLLPDGRVLIAGGGTYATPGVWTVLTTAELYDPESGTFTLTGSLPTEHHLHVATLLPNGKVLIAGGYRSGGGGATNLLNSAELYDPASGTFSSTGSLIAARAYHTATLLPNGKVLIVGGSGPDRAFKSAELYDPATGTFTLTGSLTFERRYHTATLLPSGRVLVAGGEGDEFNQSYSVELYDPAIGTFSTTGSLASAHRDPTSTLLPDGKVLIAGGYDSANVLSAAELYETSGTFTTAGGLATGRRGQTATLLTTGKVLIAGGYNDGYLTSAELYDPGGGFSPAGSLNEARAFHTATLLSDGRVLLAGGFSTGSNQMVRSAEIYDPAGGTFTLTGSMATPRGNHTATLLPNGKVLVAGGYNGAYLSSAELYDPASGTFSIAESLNTARSGATATLLMTGNVLIAGGANGADLTSAELYAPGSGTFSPTGNLTNGRSSHSATLLPNGKVLIAGGSQGAPLDAAELFDPTTGLFTVTASLATARAGHAAMLLPNGKVLMAGGEGAAGAFLASAELYDPGDGFADSRRPVITAATAALTLPGALTIDGSGFCGDSEASSGATNSSATNYPLVRLQRLDNERSCFVVPASSLGDATWSSDLSEEGSGWYRLTVVANGVPSIQQIVKIVAATPTIISVTPVRGFAGGGDTVILTGTNLLNVSVTIGGNVAMVIDTTATNATFTTPPHSPAVVDVTATTPPGVSATSVAAYTYVANPPTGVLATAQTTTSVRVTWGAAPGAATYEVMRSSDGTHYATLAALPDTEYTDTSAQPNVAYLYVVRASAPYVSEDSHPDYAITLIFTDDPLLPGSPPKAVHVEELRTAVNLLRTLAGLAPATFTDPTITPGETVIKAVHVAEIRGAISEAQTALSVFPRRDTILPPIAGFWICAADIAEPREDLK